MSGLSAQRLHAAIDATWPPAAMQRAAGFIIREGQGGGQRVSAATLDGPLAQADPAAAIAAMRALGQAPLFMVRDGETALDAELAARGLAVVDPVVALAAPCAAIATEHPPRLAAIECEFPIAALRQIWAAGGIGAGRLGVMGRVKGSRVYLLARANDRPAGAAFVACDGKVAMLHALWVSPAARRHGVARKILEKSAVWAAEQGAEWLSAVTLRRNDAARRLFTVLGMETICSYHYRKLIEEPA